MTLVPRVAAVTLLLLGCQPTPDFERLGALSADDLPASPTNAYADDPAAAALGQALFFETRMSADGQVGCVSCHDPDHAFGDPRPFSLGVFGREGGRHAPSLMNVAFNQFQLWDGRADALWAQPIKAIEAEPEGDFTRLELAHFIAAEYATPYGQVFGPVPALDHLPPRAKPGDGVWEGLSASDQSAVNRVAANVGKAIEAYERQLLCVNTEFDRFMDGQAELSEREMDGARVFLEDGRAGCVDCHSGPTLADGRFHNLGLDHAGAPDQGRAEGVAGLLADPFNGAGEFSDDRAAGAEILGQLVLGRSRDLGAFKTPGLRGVGQRDRLGHLGHETSLTRWIDDVYDRPGRSARFVGALSPQFPRGVRGGRAGAAAAFLRTFDCPPLPERLRRAPASAAGSAEAR
jgi:cytochrome c peroxidase